MYITVQVNKDGDVPLPSSEQIGLHSRVISLSGNEDGQVFQKCLYEIGAC